MNSLSFHPSGPSSPESENPRRHTGHERRVDPEEDEEEEEEEGEGERESVLGLLEGGDDDRGVSPSSALFLFSPIDSCAMLASDDGDNGCGSEEPEEEEEEERRASRQREQKEWRQGRILTGGVKMSRHTAHVREVLSSSISFSSCLGSRDSEDAEEEEDWMKGKGKGKRV